MKWTVKPSSAREGENSQTYNKAETSQNQTDMCYVVSGQGTPVAPWLDDEEGIGRAFFSEHEK